MRTTSRAKRRRAKQLDECMDQLTLEDCKFLDSRQRSYRVRVASVCEIEQMEAQLGLTLLMPPWRRLYAVVKRVPVADKQTVLKVFTENDIGVPTDDDLNEEICCALFDTIATPDMLQAEQDYMRAKS